MDEKRLFLVRAGKSGEDEELSLENGVSLVQFFDVASLEGAADFEEIKAIVAQAWPDEKPRAIGNYAGQLWAFALAAQEGDLVVMPRKGPSQIAMGRFKGPYKYREVGGEMRHTREVEWIRPDAPRTAFKQDLLYSFGAFMTVCNINRNDAVRRVAAVMEGKQDPGPSLPTGNPALGDSRSSEMESQGVPDLKQAAHDQIVGHIQAHFAGHALADLVDAVLKADGWVTKVSPPGPDGGVDILAGQGSLGLEAPRLCVQVKSQNSPADVNVYRALQGTLQAFGADYGLLVCWGGFTKAVLSAAKQGYFAMRLWDSSDLVKAIYKNYDALSAEIRADLPLESAWMLVPEDPDE